jgi:hypothetical protein
MLLVMDASEPAVEISAVGVRVALPSLALASALLVAYGRRSQWVQFLTGRLVAWGGKPWLGGRLVRYLVTP